MPTEVSSAYARPDRLPTSKSEAQALMRRHGLKGLRVHQLEEPDRGSSARAYCLTQPILSFDPAHPKDTAKARMVRRAVTVVFEVWRDEVKATRLSGWRVARELGTEPRDRHGPRGLAR